MRLKSGLSKTRREGIWTIPWELRSSALLECMAVYECGMRADAESRLLWTSREGNSPMKPSAVCFIICTCTKMAFSALLWHLRATTAKENIDLDGPQKLDLAATKSYEGSTGYYTGAIVIVIYTRKKHETAAALESCAITL